MAGRIRPILTSGAFRAFVFWIVLMLIWNFKQLNGLQFKDLNSYALLTLPLITAAIGVMLVIVMGQFDLSAMGVISLINVLMATVMTDWNPIITFVVVVGLGALVGLINGVLVVRGKLPAIAVTLATLIILQGLALVLLPQPAGKVNPVFVDVLKAPFVPIGIIVLLAVAWLVFKRTRMGLYMFALGGDAEALHLSGLPVARIRLKIFVLAGALYGLAGVFESGLTGGGDANIAKAFLLATFAAVAIGGTAFVGGTGSAIGTIFGALILEAIRKVLGQFQVSDWSQKMATGLIILLAVVAGAVSALRKSRAEALSARYTAPVEHVSSPGTEKL